MTIQNKVIITDFSFWQDNDETPYKVDLKAMRAGGIDGSIMRAGQNTWLDEDFVDYYKNAITIDFPVGAYWFYDSRSTPESQAALFAQVLKQFTVFPKLGIWADYEEKYGGPWGGAAHFRVFVEELQKRFPGKMIGIYTGPSYWVENTKPEQREWFKQFPLWIAHYKVLNPKIPFPWTDYTIWQYTESGDGYKYGVESRELDMNLFRGTFDDYRKYFLLGDIQPVEPTQEGEEGMFEVWSDVYNMTLRDAPNAFGAKLGEAIPRGTKMRADMLIPPSSGGMAGDKWAHIVEVNGMPRAGYIAIVHNGVTYCNYRETTSTPPSVLPTINFIMAAEGYPSISVEWKPNS